ncbi:MULTISPECIES: PQQ-binding-like beta-propeller repeat protein [unclassified Nocardioides]|uniref:outer membrane protein assembly factor BamB family protein n=1 Tax=unclassified Nocardioides TaxID=2615069 RepID=UPI0009F0C4E0|nr:MULTISPECIES: PQQ-binding-like beta-propeller repeat protein [unclassified Nocardioides]GAW48190.1 hypothetical protein PD653B2_0503 [Nocardioides sp. PD653-B2]GAW53446.1 hypothetical protein PD653_0845 [Nocardioides sp. PD653]
MTSQPVRSCPSCGAGLSTDAAFCSSCGTPAPPTAASDHAAFRRPGAAAAAEPPAPPRSLLPPPAPPTADVVEAGPARPARPRPRRTIGVLVALAVVGALAVGAVVASSRGAVDSEVYGYGGHLALPGAVTEKPDRDWTWQVSGSLMGLAAVADATYVVTDEGTVAALDGDGHETWTVRVEGGGFLAAPPDHDEVVLVDDAAVSRVTALATEDGAELWSAEGDVRWFDDDCAYLGTEGELVARDLDSGDRLWSVGADEVGVGEAGLFVIEGAQLLRVDPADGATTWSVDHGVIDVEMTDIAVAGDFVAVGGERATAYDASTGDPLWSSDRDDSPVVQLFARDLVAVQHIASAGGETEVQVYDREGPQGSVDGTRFGYVVPFRSGSDQYAFDVGSGDLYGDDREVIETYDGSPALAAEGLYVLRGGTVRYYAWGAAEPRWTLDEDLSDEASMQTGEGRLLIADQGRLSSYR